MLARTRESKAGFFLTLTLSCNPYPQMWPLDFSATWLLFQHCLWKMARYLLFRNYFEKNLLILKFLPNNWMSILIMIRQTSFIFQPVSSARSTKKLFYFDNQIVAHFLTVVLLLGISGNNFHWKVDVLEPNWKVIWAKVDGQGDSWRYFEPECTIMGQIGRLFDWKWTVQKFQSGQSRSVKLKM